MTTSLKVRSKATTRGEPTRRKILEAAHQLVLRHGFVATTLDRVLVHTGLTKGAFFHYFPSKSDLTLKLMERYAAEGRQSLHDALIRAERSSEDPLLQLLHFHRDCMERAMSCEPSESPAAGCLMACAAYELEEHSPEVRAIMRNFVMHYRHVLTFKLREIMKKYPPRFEVDPEEIAEHLYAVYDGGLVIGRLLGDKDALHRQLRQLEHYLLLLFSPAEEVPGVGAAGSATGPDASTSKKTTSSV